MVCIWVLNFSGFIFSLLGQPVIADFCTPKSIPAHSQNISSLFNCVCIDWRLFVIAARSSAYAAELMISFDVPNVYPFFPLCSHLSSSSKNIKNKYGLKVSPWMVPLWIGIGFDLPKRSPVNMVVGLRRYFQ